MNQFNVTACVIEKSLVRYTPAGIPVITATLSHQSEQVEAESQRQVEVLISAIAVGKITAQLLELALNQNATFSGFIARKSRNSKGLVFHIQTIVV